MLSPPDGPMLDPTCASFVGLVPTPFCHGMTPGETALCLRAALHLDSLDLQVAACPGLARTQPLRQIFPSWHATSPAIVTLANALCFPLTVFFEALPMIDHARGTPLAFQRIGSTQTDLTTLQLPELPGLAVETCEYPDKSGRRLRGLAFEIVEPRAYRPAAAAFTLIAALEGKLGPALWKFPGSRRAFYAQLWGTRTPAPPWPPFEIPRMLY
jgi:uncharacterized protein YbbC (DUF1343 family)